MSKTFSNVLTDLAYRLGENSATSNTNEKARRKAFILQGYNDLISRRAWWWTEETTTFNSQADKQIYTTTDGFPSDFREPIELRIDDIVYTYIPESKVFGLYDAGQNMFNYDSIISSKHYLIFDNSLYVYPNTASAGTNNIALKYYEYPAMPSEDTDSFTIPDTYSRALDAYAYGRISQLDGMRGDAADGFNEFEEIVREMNVEHNRRKLYGKSIRPIHPSYLVD